MIVNNRELKVVRKQLLLIEEALESLRQRCTNERNFGVDSEGYIDQIAELKTEIDAYESSNKKVIKTAKQNGKSRRKAASRPHSVKR